MPRKKSGKRRTPEPLIPLVSDGLHFVRSVSPKDRHPMPFVVDQHRGIKGLPHNPSLPRHCDSMEQATELMTSYTKRACRASPELKQAHHLAQGIEPSPARIKREPKPKKVHFSATRFICIIANPVAQVWVCTKEPWETVAVGRRAKDKRPSAGDGMAHEPGDYAVLKGDDPVLGEDGKVRVFKTRSEAEGMMNTLYLDTPGDERFSDNNDPEHPTTTVYQNLSYSVHFDPDYNGSKSPFNIFDTRNLKVVLHPRGNFPLKFRTITGAIKEADRMDREVRGV